MSTRDRLEVEAARLFAAHGYHGTSIAELADALGIRKASVYSHTKGKQALLGEVAMAGAAVFHAALDSVPTASDPLEALRLALHAHLGVVSRQIDVATVFLHEWRYLDEPTRERFLAERRRYEHRVRALFERACLVGVIDPRLDVRRAALVFLSVGNWAYSWLAHAEDVDAEADALWSIMLDGMRAQWSLS